MNLPTLSLVSRRFASALAAAVLLASVASMLKAAEESTAEPKAPTKDEVLTLSPFTVNAARDVGFVAASSLAGGRLAGDLKDTPVAYSVLTREFIDALGLTDLTEMSKWATNAGTRAEDGGEYVVGNSIALSSRGVASNAPQRDFFPVFYNFDSYNIERLDLARGPNAVLFGTSGVGGTANSVTKQARTDKQFTELRTGYGSWANLRTTLDYNLPLSSSLAVRLNALYQDREGWRDGDSETRKGLTLSATWKPTSSTEVRAGAEWGTMSRAVITTTFQDNVSAWDGKAVYSARIPTFETTKGISYEAQRAAVYTPSNGDGLLNYQGWAKTLGGNSASNVPAGGTLVVGATANIYNAPILDQINVPENLYDIAEANSFFRVPSRTTSTFPDAKLFGVNNREITVAITQRFGDKFFAEVAGNVGKEDTDSDVGIVRTMQRLYLDPNKVLPNGNVNPNFLQPYVQAFSYPYKQFRDKKNLRFALGYVGAKTRWGEFAFNTIGGWSTQSYDRNNFRYILKLPTVDHRTWPSAVDLPVWYRYYLNTDQTRPMPMPDSWSYTDPITGTTSTVPAGLVRDYQNSNYNQLLDIDYKYLQAAGNAKFFKNRLIVLGAVRRDQYRTHQQSEVAQYDNPADWDGYTLYFKPDAPADWTSLTYQLRDSAGKPYGAFLPAETRPRVSNLPDARYASDRFRSDYSPPDSRQTVDTKTIGAVFHATKNLTAFANYAESFQPPTSALKLNGSIFQPEASKGHDYGVRVTLLDGALVANLIRYDGYQNNAPLNGSTYYNNFTAMIKARKREAPVETGAINSQGLLPVPIYTDTAEVKTQGWELEVTANLTRNWRLMVNAATPQAKQNHPFAETQAYWAANKETYRAVVKDAGGVFNGNVATYDNAPTVPANWSPTNDGVAAVNGWNNIESFLASIADGQKLNRVTEVVANVFTDYTFRTGWLKGFRAGAGVNYRGREVIGTRGADTMRNPANANAAIDDPSVGPYDYVYSDPYSLVTLTFNYTRVFKRKYTLSVDLRVSNVLDYDEPFYFNTVLRPPGGDLTNPSRVATPYAYGWQTPRNYTLSTTIRF